MTTKKKTPRARRNEHRLHPGIYPTLRITRSHELQECITIFHCMAVYYVLQNSIVALLIMTGGPSMQDAIGLPPAPATDDTLRPI